MRILIIEDEVRLANTMADMLAENHYTIDLSFDGESGLDNALTGIYDAIVLDVMLPKLSGFSVLKTLREQAVFTPVLMLSAKRDLQDRVRGLDLGADYYLTKPFENDEFKSCLRALLRRPGALLPESLVYGDATLIPSACELKCGELAVQLSLKELEMMRLLMLSGENNTPKETLLTKVWGYESEAVGNNVEAYISFLRKKLNLIGSKVSIVAARRIGYHLEAN